MLSNRFLLVFGLCFVVVVAEVQRNERRDRFRLILSNVTSQQTEEEISDFLNYGCEAMISVSNDAKEPMRLRCRSRDDKPRDARIYPGNNYLFTIRPLVDGSSEYWCILSYRHFWVRFDAYSEQRQSYLCPGRKVYRYSVRHDGVYADPTRDDGVKIRALFKGHNEFSIWEDYNEDTETADGLLTKGFVDGGMCSDLPDHFDDKASAITICNHQCVLLYQDRRCSGVVQKFQAGDGCHNMPIQENLKKSVSAIKGC